jgi:general secretion pathway protein G
MAKQSRNYLGNIKSQNNHAAGKNKFTARELWSLIWPIPLGGLGILLMMGSIGEMMTSHHGNSSNSRIAKIQIAEFEQALEAYSDDNGSYPTNEQGLKELSSYKGNGPYLKKVLPFDPWGRSYHYCIPGVRNPSSYDIWSNGPDGIEGTKDDIYNLPE